MGPIGSLAIGAAFPVKLTLETFAAAATLTFTGSATAGASSPFGAEATLSFTTTAGGRKLQYFGADSYLLFTVDPNLRVAGKPFRFHAIPQHYKFRAVRVDYDFAAVPRSYTFRSVR